MAVSEGEGVPGGPRPAMGCRCQAVSMPSATRGVMDWRIEPMTTPWNAGDVKSGFMALRFSEVEASRMSCSIWKTPPG